MLYVTVPSSAEAVAIGRQLVGERLAACVNVLPNMTSVYRWQGQIEQADEAVLLVKTRQELVQSVTSRILTLHSCEVPCVISWTIPSGNPDYLQWIQDETTDRDDALPE